MSIHLGLDDDDMEDVVVGDRMDSDEDNPRDEIISDVENDGEINDGEEANEVVDGAVAAITTPKPKRIIKNPQPKLNCQRLKTAKGLSALPGHFKDFKFKGRGHEVEDLSRILRRLEHWAHRLFPRLQFADFVQQMEALGKKQECQVLLKMIRLDMHEPLEDTGLIGEDNDPTIRGEPDDPQENLFDDLLGDRRMSCSPPPPPRPCQPEVLTEEQVEQIERNRLLAIQKRKARILAQQASQGIVLD